MEATAVLEIFLHLPLPQAQQFTAVVTETQFKINFLQQPQQGFCLGGGQLAADVKL